MVSILICVSHISYIDNIYTLIKFIVFKFMLLTECGGICSPRLKRLRQKNWEIEASLCESKNLGAKEKREGRREPG